MPTLTEKLIVTASRQDASFASFSPYKQNIIHAWSALTVALAVCGVDDAAAIMAARTGHAVKLQDDDLLAFAEAVKGTLNFVKSRATAYDYPDPYHCQRCDAPMHQPGICDPCWNDPDDGE